MIPKRICALLLALCLLWSLCAFAEDTPAFQPGDTVDLTFAVTDNPNLAIGATLRLIYDHGAFELIPSPYTQNDAPIISPNIKGIPVGEMVDASFRVLPSAAAGVYEFQIMVVQAGDIDENEVDGLAFTECRVEICDPWELLSQANAENEDLRRQLEEMKKALEDEKARADAEKAELQEQVEALKNQPISLPSPETDFTYSIRKGKATITKYNGECGGVVIPDTLGGYPVGEIGNRAFSGCSGLISVTIPDGVTSIGDSAFRGCGSLTSVTLPGSVTSIGAYAFSNCTSLQSIAIPGSVTAIGGNAFKGCSSLQSVIIPDSVTSIGNYAFYGCGNNLIFYVQKGSYAEAFCKDWKLTYQAQ